MGRIALLTVAMAAVGMQARMALSTIGRSTVWRRMLLVAGAVVDLPYPANRHARGTLTTNPFAKRLDAAAGTLFSVVAQMIRMVSATLQDLAPPQPQAVMERKKSWAALSLAA